MTDGVIVIDKPEGFTSHDVVAKLRRILRTKKIGHTGTLDPFATGVLVMMVGRATRLARFQSGAEKQYDAVLRFGFETDTGDRTGEPREGGKLPRDDVTVEKIHEVLPEFTGCIEQVPPMYSAKKVQGERLYKLAREGREIERQPVSVTITKLECTGEIGRTARTADFGLTVTCSAGTYVRSLAEDIGRAVGIGCHLAELRRTRAGRFGIDQACTLEELEEIADPLEALLPVLEAVAHLPSIELGSGELEDVRHGRAVLFDGTLSGDIALIAPDGTLAAVGFADKDSGGVRPKIVVI